jgi:hypothetical protein
MKTFLQKERHRVTDSGQYKRWTRRVLVSITLLVGIVVAINAVVDAYGILRTDFSLQPHGQVPNMNYIKMKYLLEHKERFDSFIFGSSRVWSIDPLKIPGGKYYNMTYTLGLPQEHLANIRYLLKNGVTVKNVLIGIDEFSYQIDPGPRRSNLMTQPLPAISGKKLEDFYGEYFFKLQELLPQLKAYIRHNYTHKNDHLEQHMWYDMFGTGRVFCRDCDEEIEKNRAAHARNFSKPAWLFDGEYVQGAIAALSDTVALCRAHNIHLVLFISPSEQVAYLTTNLERFARFKKELAGVTAYYDFSGLNSVTTDPYYFYEPLHYRPILGDMMLNVMYGAPDVTVPSDFGTFVNADNVDVHLKNQCLEINQIRASIPLSAVNVSYADSCSQSMKSVADPMAGKRLTASGH